MSKCIINIWNKLGLTLSVMSLSASSMMSRVKSLMVSRVMELFWRRCLHVWKGEINSIFPGSHWQIAIFLIANKHCCTHTWKMNSVQLFSLPCNFFAGQPFTSTLGGQNNRKTGQEKKKRDGGKRHYLLISTTPIPHSVSVWALQIRSDRQKQELETIHTSQQTLITEMAPETLN